MLNIENMEFIDILKNMKNLGIDKKWILDNIDRFDLKKQDKNGWNFLMYIIYYNKFYYNEKYVLGFTKEDIFALLDKFDLKQQDINGMNILMILIEHNASDVYFLDKLGLAKFLDKTKNLKISKKELLSILDKFDLNQKTTNSDNKNIYDFIINIESFNFEKFNETELAYLVSKLDIEIKDKNNNNILIKELENGLFFNSEELSQKILDTKNKDIINCVYKHIQQITWKHDELLIFLKKNQFPMNSHIFSTI